MSTAFGHKNLGKPDHIKDLCKKWVALPLCKKIYSPLEVLATLIIQKATLYIWYAYSDGRKLAKRVQQLNLNFSLLHKRGKVWVMLFFPSFQSWLGNKCHLFSFHKKKNRKKREEHVNVECVVKECPYFHKLFIIATR